MGWLWFRDFSQIQYTNDSGPALPRRQRVRMNNLVGRDTGEEIVIDAAGIYGPLTPSLANTTGAANNQLAFTSGRASVNDGAALEMQFAAGESAGADGFLKINAVDGQWRALTPGRVGYMDIRWFGAVSSRTVSSSAAVQAAVTAAGNNGRVFIPPSEFGYLCSNVVVPNGWIVEFFGAGYSNISNAQKGAAEWDSLVNIPVRGSYLTCPAGQSCIVAEKGVVGSVGLEFNNMAIQGLGAGANKLVDAYRGTSGMHTNLRCNKFGTFNAEYGVDLVESYANRSIIDHAASGCTYPLSLGREGTGLGVTAVTIINPQYNGNTHAVRMGNCVSVVLSGGLIQGIVSAALIYGECSEVEVNGAWFEGLLGDLVEMIADPPLPASPYVRRHCGFVRAHIDGTFSDTITGLFWYFRSTRAPNLVLNGLEGSAYVSPECQINIRNTSGFKVLYDGIGNLAIAISTPAQNININTMSGLSRVDLEMTANGSITFLGSPDIIAGADILLTVKSTGAIRTLTINCDQYAGSGGGTTIPWTGPGGAGEVCSARLTRSGFGWTIAQGAWA